MDVTKVPSDFKPSQTEEGAFKLFEDTCVVVFHRCGDLNVSHSLESLVSLSSF